MDSNTKLIEAPNSTKISINAKGLWSGEVKVYADTIDNAMKTALEKANELNEVIKKQNSL